VSVLVPFDESVIADVQFAAKAARRQNFRRKIKLFFSAQYNEFVLTNVSNLHRNGNLELQTNVFFHKTGW